MSVAITDDRVLDRYMKLLHFLRSTLLTVGCFVLVGCALLGCGVGAAVYVAGLSPRAAAGLGVLGTTTTLYVAGIKLHSLYKRLTGPARPTNDDEVAALDDDLPKQHEETR
ncbi:hypothetical protein [Nocardia australiensis]|uniref:hypothetical protein n=1 Tax=Nocardia australiensis TaxID=2887191 RepID=UPI001D15BB67|nr:hypothetical protein [Nocardia australiensis]